MMCSHAVKNCRQSAYPQRVKVGNGAVVLAIVLAGQADMAPGLARYRIAEPD